MGGMQRRLMKESLAATGAVTEGLAAKARVQWNIATGAVAFMHDVWLQWERL